MRLAKILYFDHLEFCNTDPTNLKPVLRQVTGWVLDENEDYLLILSEMAITNNLEELAKLRPSGFVIIKNDIEEIVDLNIP